MVLSVSSSRSTTPPHTVWGVARHIAVCVLTSLSVLPLRVARHACRVSLASAAYAMGFFRDLSSVAFASDAIIDLIPVDTTAALVIAAAAAAAAANGPYTGSSARVYHAASAASYPERAPAFFEKLHDFWTANPPPFKLPGAR